MINFVIIINKSFGVIADNLLNKNIFTNNQ